MFIFYSIRNIDSSCTRLADLIGDIYLYIIKIGCFLNICTHVIYTNLVLLLLCVFIIMFVRI